MIITLIYLMYHKYLIYVFFIRYSVADTPFSVPANIVVSDLSDLINKLLLQGKHVILSYMLVLQVQCGMGMFGKLHEYASTF